MNEIRGCRKTEPDSKWLDCGNVQCAQVHTLLDALLANLGAACDKSIYSAGKTARVMEALEERSPWIEIKPGCRMPKSGEEYIVSFKDGSRVFGRDWFSRLDSTWFSRLDATHWMPIVPPPQPDPFEAWWRSPGPAGIGGQTPKEIARRGWDAALEHARKERTP